jgi:hypothetical protein
MLGAETIAPEQRKEGGRPEKGKKEKAAKSPALDRIMEWLRNGFF